MTAERDQPLFAWGVCLALVSAFGFSFKAILIKLAYPYGVDAITLLMLRMLFALPVFAWFACRGGQPLERGDRWRLLALGCLGYYGASIFDFWGLQYISAGLERLILFTYPTLTLIFAWLWQGRRSTRRDILALVICYVGIGFAFVHDFAEARQNQVWLGSALVFASAFCYALYLAGSGSMLMRLGVLRFTSLSMLVSTAAITLHFVIVTPSAHQALFQPTPVLAYALAMALFSTVLPVFAQSAAIKHLGASRASLIGMVGPMLTIGFGWSLLHEPISFAQILGALLTVVGIVLVSRR